MIIGIGCDIVEIERIRNQSAAFATRILTEKEYACYCEYTGNRKIEYLAGRFAAKEAIFKALQQPIVIHDIEILNHESGQPYCLIDGFNIQISIAHETSYAIAYAIVERG